MPDVVDGEVDDRLPFRADMGGRFAFCRHGSELRFYLDQRRIGDNTETVIDCVFAFVETQLKYDKSLVGYVVCQFDSQCFLNREDRIRAYLRIRYSSLQYLNVWRVAIERGFAAFRCN